MQTFTAAGSPRIYAVRQPFENEHLPLGLNFYQCMDRIPHKI